ncbi:MAG TPA: alpha/beta fold hydrolase, partial [Acidimicrobiales bacterium]|nr:alpha/beta fold hydrolase [Acidimicrobiales bacterium]
MSDPVLLVHGFGSSFKHQWADPGWVDLLTDAGRQVLGGDLLGHGSAPKPTDPADYAGIDQWVEAMAEGHDRIDAVGFSMGARILLELVCAKPDRFGRL